MKAKNYIGIDPGSGNGGIAVLDEEGRVAECVKMPETPSDILSLLRGLASQYPDAVCYMESVGMGMPGQSSKATATFSRHNGHLEMALLATGIPTVMVSPQKWQKALGLSGKKGESKHSHKNRIKDWAKRREPKIDITLWNADAIAIAVYGSSSASTPAAKTSDKKNTHTTYDKIR